MTQDGAATPAPRKGMGRAIYVPTILLVLGCLAWSAYWFVAARMANAGFDAWMAQEAAQNRRWTCGGRDLSGFPFRLELVCPTLAYEGPLGEKTLRASARGLHTFAHLYQPGLVIARLDGPLQLSTGDAAATLAWTDLQASIHVSTGGLQRFSLVAEAPSLKAGDGLALGAATHVEIHARPTPAAAKVANGLDLALTVRDAAAPALDALAGNADPLAIDATLTASRADLLANGLDADALDRWREASAGLTGLHLNIGKGATGADLTGDLGLDEMRRLRGTLQAQLRGLGPILARLGMPAGAVAIQGILGGLLGGKARAPAEAGSVSLPLILGNGRLMVGPVTTPVRLPPLY